MSDLPIRKVETGKGGGFRFFRFYYGFRVKQGCLDHLLLGSCPDAGDFASFSPFSDWVRDTDLLLQELLDSLKLVHRSVDNLVGLLDRT